MAGPTDDEPQQRFFTSQRTRLSYWDWGNPLSSTGGDAPPLIFVHGGGDESRSWDRLARAFRDEFHVLALDVRGHGDSEWNPGSQYAIPDVMLDVVRLAEITGQPARIVGHSYGASTCLIAAGTFPERFAGVVAIEGTHTMNPPDLQDEGMGPAFLRRWADSARALEAREERGANVYPSREAMVERMRERQPHQPEDWVRHLVEHGSRPVEDGYAWKFDPWQRHRTSMEIRQHELERFWANIACPVLLLFAPPSLRQGRAFQRHDAARYFPNARGVTVEDTGHHIQHEQTARTIEEMRKFFAETKDYTPPSMREGAGVTPRVRQS